MDCLSTKKVPIFFTKEKIFCWLIYSPLFLRSLFSLPFFQVFYCVSVCVNHHFVTDWFLSRFFTALIYHFWPFSFLVVKIIDSTLTTLLRLRETQKALQLRFYFFLSFPSLSFSSLFLDRLAKVIFKVLSSGCFERVWPGLELIIW